MLIDTHAHLQDNRYSDVQAVITSATACGVEKIICVGSDLDTSRQAVALAERFAGVFAAVGLHPQDVTVDFSAVVATLGALAKHPKVVAIGEIGLEYRAGCPEPALQQSALRAQLQLAASLSLPVQLHCREATGDMLKLLADNPSRCGGIWHCFGESIETAHQIFRLGLCVSVGGVVTFENATRLQAVVAQLPLEKLMLETDSPYLAPSPFRGTINAPARITTIAEKIAALQGCSIDRVAKVTTDNAMRVFGL